MAQKIRITSRVKIALLVSFFFLTIQKTSLAQTNMFQIGYLDLATMHGSQLNDIWGYTDELGNEYAIVGLQDGTSIVDVSDPINPVEIQWIPGMNSVWRDIKTVGDYAYVTTEAFEGLLIIDLTSLPVVTTFPTYYYTGPSGDEWEAAHNLYAADGYLYIAGANRGNGGIIILDVMTDPINPIEVGEFDPWYAHDAYVRNDTGYFSHILDGFFTIVDLADKTNVTVLDVLGSSNTPNNFSHNAWLSDDGNTLFTTDEVPGGKIGSYNISDPGNIVFLDQIQSSPGNNVIPHNVHVKGDFLFTSFYTDGVVIHDVSDPSNIIEVGNYDTSPDYAGDTFNGCWGVYPFFTSDIIVASDIEKGLYILGQIPPASNYLQGTITNAGTGQPLNNALVELLGTAFSDNSNAVGYYGLGSTLEGNYDVRYSRAGYIADTISLNLINGQNIVQDVALVQIPLFTATITVVDDVTNLPIQNALVRIDHTQQIFEGVTDVNGQVSFDLFYEDNYDVTVGKWTHTNNCLNSTFLSIVNNTLEIPIEVGIYDDFTFDYGWTTSATATVGFWVRDIPLGAQSGGTVTNPPVDATADCHKYAYVTGNSSSQISDDDIDNGSVTLVSPVMDFSSYVEPELNFSYWFYNGFGIGTPNDSLIIRISNGIDTERLAAFGVNNTPLSQWTELSFVLADYISLTATMQLSLVATDFSPGHIMEAGIDHLRVTELYGVSLKENDESHVKIYPNPANTTITVSGIDSGLLTIYDLTGRLVLSSLVVEQIDISSLEKGMYLITLFNESNEVIKTQVQVVE